MSSLSSRSISAKSKFIWRFTPEKFAHLPSCTFKRQPLNIDEELIQRQQLSMLIYELASHLNVSFSCVYTSVVYMHRFFMLHPFQQCLKESVAAACLFLACKVNEIPRPLNEFARYLHQIRNNNEDASLAGNLTSEVNRNENNSNQQIIDYENMLLSTLGFCLHIEQPYLIITRTSQTLSIPMEITQKAYEIATKCIFFTLFSLKCTTNLIACFALYLALASSQINIPINEDGSQWFHLLNEEFTEKLLQELVDEYQVICTRNFSLKFQQRFDQLRQQKKISPQQVKPKQNGEQSNSTLFPHDGDQHHPIASTSGSVRSTTSSSSSIPQPSNFYEHGSNDIHQHTPNRSSSVTIPHVDYSPTTVFQSASPKEVTNNFSEQYHSNNSLISSAKPIPTLMTSSNMNSYHNSNGSRYHARYSLPSFQYSLSSPTQRVFRPPPPLPLHPQQYHPQYSTNYVLPPSYYPQQQTPLFYHPTNLTNKRYGEPPAPPTKRFRCNINPHQHY